MTKAGKASKGTRPGKMNRGGPRKPRKRLTPRGGVVQAGTPAFQSGLHKTHFFSITSEVKQCPACKTTYTDDTLTYCLADGTSLVASATEEVTVVRHHGVRVDIEPPKTVSSVSPKPEQKSGGAFWKIAITIGILGAVGFIASAAALAIYLFGYSGTNVGSNMPAPPPSPRPAVNASPTPDAEKERLQKELANLQKQIDDDKKVETNKTPFGSDTDGWQTATVNSPNDGFLALRSEPDAETGERLAQIPHGAVVRLENCEKERVKIGSRTGRWCMVTYKEQTGWVFDAWLTY